MLRTREVQLAHRSYTHDHHTTCARMATLTCCICLEEPSTGVVRCDLGHATCEGCIDTYVLTKAEALSKTNMLAAQAEAAATTNDEDRLAQLGGACFCPMHGTYGRCGAPPFDDRTLAAHTTKETFAEYVRAKALLPAAQRVQLVVQKRQEMSMLFPDARQCGHCSFGPVSFHGCTDLTTHHGEVRRGGAAPVDNSCRRCGWFAPDISAWPTWDPTAAILGAGGEDPLHALHAQAEAVLGAEAGDEEAAAVRVAERQQQAIRYRQEREERRRMEYEEHMARRERAREREREFPRELPPAPGAGRADHGREALREERERLMMQRMEMRQQHEERRQRERVRIEQMERLYPHPLALPPLALPRVAPRVAAPRAPAGEADADVGMGDRHVHGLELEDDMFMDMMRMEDMMRMDMMRMERIDRGAERLQRDHRDRALERELEALEHDVVGMERRERFGALERDLAEQAERRAELERRRAAAAERRARRIAEALRAPEPADPPREDAPAVPAADSAAAAAAAPPGAPPAAPPTAVAADQMVRRLNGELQLARPSEQSQEERRDAMALFVRLTGLVADGGAARMYLEDAAWDVEAAVRAAVQGAVMPSPSAETPPPCPSEEQPEHQQEVPQVPVPVPPQDTTEAMEVVGEAH